MLGSKKGFNLPLRILEFPDLKTISGQIQVVAQRSGGVRFPEGISLGEIMPRVNVTSPQLVVK